MSSGRNSAIADMLAKTRTCPCTPFEVLAELCLDPVHRLQQLAGIAPQRFARRRDGDPAPSPFEQLDAGVPLERAQPFARRARDVWREPAPPEKRVRRMYQLSSKVAVVTGASVDRCCGGENAAGAANGGCWLQTASIAPGRSSAGCPERTIVRKGSCWKIFRPCGRRPTKCGPPTVAVTSGEFGRFHQAGAARRPRCAGRCADGFRSDRECARSVCHDPCLRSAAARQRRGRHRQCFIHFGVHRLGFEHRLRGGEGCPRQHDHGARPRARARDPHHVRIAPAR